MQSWMKFCGVRVHKIHNIDLDNNCNETMKKRKATTVPEDETIAHRVKIRRISMMSDAEVLRYHSQSRNKIMSAERIYQKKLKDQLRKRKARADMTEEERDTERARNRDQHQVWRSNQTEEERNAVRVRNREEQQTHRGGLTEEERGVARAQNREEQQTHRGGLTEEERGAARARNRDEQQTHRSLTPDTYAYGILIDMMHHQIDLVS